MQRPSCTQEQTPSHILASVISSLSLSLTSRPCVVTALADPPGWRDGRDSCGREKSRGESEWRSISERRRIKPAYTAVGQVDLRTLNPRKICVPQTSLLWRAFYRSPSVDECPTTKMPRMFTRNSPRKFKCLPFSGVAMYSPALNCSFAPLIGTQKF